MVENSDEIPMKKCSLEADGNVTCKINKKTFNDIQRRNIKPKRVIFEIE